MNQSSRSWTRLAAALSLASSLGLASGSALAKSEAPVRPVAYRGTILFDGTGSPVRPGMTLVVTGERISAIQPDNAPLPPDTRVVDATGLYALPGLIDAHVHIATPPDAARARRHMKRWLYSGVTAVRGMADDLRSVAELARQARVGEIPSPDIHYAALMAGPGFFRDPRTQAVSAGAVAGRTPWMQAINQDTDIPLAMAMARGTGASGIKIYADLPVELVRALTDEAHRQGIPVWAHAMVYPTAPQQMIEAGPDVLSHACILAHQAQPAAQRPATYASRTPIERAPFLAGDHPVIQSLVEQIRDRGLILDATVRVYVEQDARHAAGQAREPVCSGPMTAAITAQAWRAGVMIAAGTDGETADPDPWPALFEELELLQDQVGMSPAQVLVSATRINAAALGQSADMGTLEVGKLANFILTRQDPTTDVARLRSLTTVVKRGQAVHRADYGQP